ncbi:MAG: EAL domain-containing protein [Gammaproteobacteria bacterium]|nr:MAG: EAL domain-containing protein [Gammaproteobacteria bacterium]
MTEEHLHLTPSQIDELLQSLHRYHAEYGALGTMLDEGREQRMLDGFRHFLVIFLERPEEDRQPMMQLAQNYFEQEIPFVLLMGAFNHIKTRLIELVSSNTRNPISHCAEIDRLFEQAKRATAQEYLLLEVERPDPMPQSRVRQKTLIRICLEWLEQVRRAIRHDLDSFPLETPADSRFTEALAYPESMMICLDLKLCDQLRESHRIILQQAAILYAMLGGQRYEQAYVIWQDLVKQVSELLNLLGMLYFESETNRLNRFFSFVQAALYLPGRKFLCVLNLAQLQRINHLYGPEAGGRALDYVATLLDDEFTHNQDWLLFTRGVAGDFYVMGHNTDPAQLQALCARIRDRLADKGSDIPFELDISYYGIELTELNELNTEDLHLVIEYLSECASREDKHIASGEEEGRRLLQWLQERYRRSIDLRARLTPEGTTIFIQPLVSLDEERVLHAFEVLGRFREGEGHIIAGMFIDDIVAAGLVTDFDRLILEHIVAQAPQLRRITHRLFINVSPASLQDPDYLATLKSAIRGPLDDLEIVIELTEQVLMERRQLITELHREHGLVFAVDDFGVGYSSLQMVIELAMEGSIRYLKLDGSLTRNLTESEAVQRVMQITRQMAHELGLTTVVEVIETLDQFDRLEAMRMDLGQGFLLGVPDTVPVWRGKISYLQTRSDTASGPILVL